MTDLRARLCGSLAMVARNQCLRRFFECQENGCDLIPQGLTLPHWDDPRVHKPTTTSLLQILQWEPYLASFILLRRSRLSIPLFHQLLQWCHPCGGQWHLTAAGHSSLTAARSLLFQLHHSCVAVFRALSPLMDLLARFTTERIPSSVLFRLRYCLCHAQLTLATWRLLWSRKLIGTCTDCAYFGQTYQPRRLPCDSCY